MSRSRDAGGWLVAAGAVVLTLGALVLIGGGGSDRPLDPRSDARLGTSAMVALAGELGAEVTVDDRLPDLDSGGPDVMVLLVDLLDDEQRVVVDDWIERGGRLIVTDPASDYAPESDRSFAVVDDLSAGARRCEIDALDGIDVAGVEPRNGGVLYRPVGVAELCVGDGLGAGYIVATGRAEGTVVAVGGSGMFVNAALAEGENAPVVAALVAPRAGTEVLVLEPGRLAGTTGTGDEGVADLIPDGVVRAFLQLTVAFVVYAAWRARRLGRPVTEPQPVAVAGSELVAAVGNLLDRTRSPDHAARLLRGDLHRFLADHLGLPAGSPPEVVVAVAVDRTGVDEASLRWALGPAPVTDDAGLVALARTIDRIRTEVLAHV
jgi:hypothetical protein